MFRTKMSEEIKVQSAVTSGGLNYAQLNDTDNHDTTVFLDMRDYDSAEAIAITSAYVAGNWTLTMLQATSAAGAGAKAVGTASLVTPTAASTNTVSVLATDFDVAGGFRYVGARVATSGANAGNYVTIVLLQGKPRVLQQTLS